MVQVLVRVLPCYSGDITWNQRQCSGDQGFRAARHTFFHVNFSLSGGGHLYLLLTKPRRGHWFRQIRIWSTLTFPTVMQTSRLQTEKKRLSP